MKPHLNNESVNKRANKVTKATLFLGPLVFAMGQSILFALAGPVARQIGLVEWQVGVIVSAAAAVFVVASPVWGRLSDRWGRKTVIVAGLFGYGLTTLMFAGVLHAGLAGAISAPLAFAGLLISRLLYAIASGGIQPAAVALMADITSAEDRSAGIALIGAGFGMGTVLGPSMAAALVGLGVLAPLFVAAGLAVIVAVVTNWQVQEPKAGPQVGDAKLSAKIDIGMIAPYLALAFGTYVAISAIQQTTAFYVQDFTETNATRAAQLSGFAFMALASAMLVVQGGIVQALKPSPKQMLGIGLPVAALGVAGYAYAPSVGSIIVAFAVMGGGFGLVQTGIGALISLRVSADSQGGAAGYVQAAMAGGFVIGPLAGTLLYALSPVAPAVLALVSLGACLVLFLALSMRTSRVAATRSPSVDMPK